MTKRTGDQQDDTHWRVWFVVILIAIVAWLLWTKWNAIYWFALSDTDDNMRIAQVRGLLHGQGWYDLRQHRMNPPQGASIHWSRLVDLPIAGLILLLRPVFGAIVAEKWACAIAPMLPFGVTLYATMTVVRRLVGRWAFLPAAAIMVSASSMMAMFMPTRIDHHGWQLATLVLVLTGLTDPRPARGGLIAGAATAVSLTIGLEFLPYLAAVGGALGLWWVADRTEAERLGAYGVALAGGAALGYGLFASYDNANPVCDALSPVYLSTLMLAGAALVAVARLPIERRRWRLAVAIVVGVALLAFFALTWPQCLSRPEHVSPALDRLWLSHVREAKPVYAHGWRTSLTVAALPVMGVIGAALAWRGARGGPLALPWAVVAGLSLCAALLLLWQTRASAGAQLLAVPGATALAVMLMARTFGSPVAAVRVFGTVAAFLLASGAWGGMVTSAFPEDAHDPWLKRVNQANRRCPTLPALRPIAHLPPATILTFLDLGPRLISVTPHSVIAGPYHRNGAAILDVEAAFRSPDPAVARDVMRRHGATLVLICPGMSESTVYAAEAKRGFYKQLADGRVPGWLTPVPLPRDSPFRLWRVVDPAS